MVLHQSSYYYYPVSRCCIKCPGVVSGVNVLFQLSGCCFMCQGVVSGVRVLFHMSGCCFRCQGVVSGVLGVVSGVQVLMRS